MVMTHRDVDAVTRLYRFAHISRVGVEPVQKRTDTLCLPQLRFTRGSDCVDRSWAQRVGDRRRGRHSIADSWKSPGSGVRQRPLAG